MASIRREFEVNAPAEAAWAAVHDFGAVHERLAPGFVVDARVDGDARVLTFGNGMVAREVLVDVDHAARRLVYSVQGGAFTHDNAAVRIVPLDKNRCRFIWHRDMLPNDLADAVAAMMDEAVPIMKRTLEQPA